jgi:CheY-like chemotaxis protein
MHPTPTGEPTPEASGEPPRVRALVLEDDATIRVLVARVLARLGYEVVSAEDGETAIELYRRALDAGERFRFVLMDLTIPGGMGGQDAVAHLRALDPQVRAIVMSGLSTDSMVSDFGRFGFRGAIVKPFRTADLVAVVAQVMADSAD